MMRIVKWLGAALLGLAWLAGAAAQDLDASTLVRGGLQAVQLIDQGRLDELWDGAAAVAKKRVPRADFISQVNKVRQPLGAPQQRVWVSVSRQALANEDADAAGQYVSVEFETRFAGHPAGTVRELVSFHLDREGNWRFAGYFIR